MSINVQVNRQRRTTLVAAISKPMEALLRKGVVLSILSLCLIVFSALPLSAASSNPPPFSIGIVNTNANLRTGPGIEYAKVGFMPAGTHVEIAACNSDCSWYLLSTGKWIREYLVTIEDCDFSYPGVCIPSAPPDLDCDDLSVTNFQVIGADPHGFDGDKDGVGCEQNPPPPPLCDPNYSGACIRRVSYDLDCKDVLPYKGFQSIGSDPHRFDGDKDGLACEK